jgi:hypothetical protein
LATAFSFLFGINEWSTDIKISLGIGVLIITIIGTLFTNWVKLKLGTKQLDITQSANSNDASIKLLETMNSVVKQEILDRDKFWLDRLDVVREQNKNALIDLRRDSEVVLEKKERIWKEEVDGIRDEKHKVANECTALSVKFGTLKNLIQSKGHKIVETNISIDIIWTKNIEGRE